MTPLADTVIPPPGAATLGAIEMIAASSLAKGTIWVGTNNGLIKVTRDNGKTWNDASIPKLPYPTRALVEGLVAFADAGRHRVCGRERLAHGRLRAVRLSHARFRQDVDEHRERTAHERAER